jgi:hypothetical protein
MDTFVASPALVEAWFPARPLVALQRARLEEARGQVERAGSYYTRFLDWYDMPSDRVRHLVDDAEAALARLAQEGR